MKQRGETCTDGKSALLNQTSFDDERRFAKIKLDGRESWHAIKKLLNLPFSRSGIQ